MIPCLHLPHPQGRGVPGGLEQWDCCPKEGQPPASPPSWGSGHTPNCPDTEQSPAWPLGPADPSSIPPGLGESPRQAHCPTPATFPLPHCSRYQHPTRFGGCTGRRGFAEAAAEAADGPGVLLAGLPAQSGAPMPVSESRPAARVVECRVRGPALFGASQFLVLETLGPGPLLSSYDNGKHSSFATSLHQGPCTGQHLRVTVSFSVEFRPVCSIDRTK